MAFSADLHTHSSRSDGVLSPTELVRQANGAGLSCLALTDHDSVAGVEEATVAAHELGITVISGVELSVRDRHGVEDHLLGFFIDAQAASLNAYLSKLQQEREAMAEHTLVALAQAGVPVSRERVAELARGAVVTRPHIARAMVEAGHVASEQEAFDRFLGSGKPAAPRRPAADPAHAVATIREAGGVAGLAHPVFSQEPTAAERLAQLPPRLDRLVEAGLAAVECFYPDATPEVSQTLERLASARKLIATGGTDYHGPGKAPYAPLGQVTVNAATIAALEAARAG